MPKTNLLSELKRTFDEIDLKKENFSKNTMKFVSDVENNGVKEYTNEKWGELTEEAKGNFLLRAMMYMCPHTSSKCIHTLMDTETVPALAMSLMKRDNLDMLMLDSIRHRFDESEITNYLQIADGCTVDNNTTDISAYVSERTMNLLLSDMINRKVVLYDGIPLKYATNETNITKAMQTFEDEEKVNTQIANNDKLPNDIRNTAFSRGYDVSIKTISLTDEMKEEIYLGCADTYTEPKYIGDKSFNSARYESGICIKQLLYSKNMTGIAQYDLYERLSTMDEDYDNSSVFFALVGNATERKVFSRLAENRRFLGDVMGDIYKNPKTPSSFYRTRANYLLNEIDYIKRTGSDIFMIQKYKTELLHIINRVSLDKKVYKDILALKDNVLSIAVYTSPNTPESIITANKKNLPPPVEVAKRYHMELLHSVFNKNERLYEIALNTIAVAATSYEGFEDGLDLDFDVEPSSILSENNVYNREVPPLHIKLLNKAMTDTEKSLEDKPEVSTTAMHITNNFKLITETISSINIIGSQLNGFLIGQQPKEAKAPIIVWGGTSTDYNIDFEQLSKLDFKKCEKEIEQEWLEKTDSTSMFDLRQKIEDKMTELIQGLNIASFIKQYANASKLYNIAQRVEIKLDQNNLENEEKQTDFNMDER